MAKTILSFLITILSGVGSYDIMNRITQDYHLIVIGIIVTIMICLTYSALWYRDMDNVEHNIIKDRLQEDRIPVIGSRYIDWDEELDLPAYDMNNTIKFDRNKIIYNPKTLIKS